MAKQREYLMSKFPEAFAPGRPWQNLHQVEICHKMLYDIRAIFEEAKIPFWLIFGTVLGIYRNGCLLPYDGDIDIGIMSEDFDRVLSLESKFMALGYEELGLCGRGFIVLCKEGEHTDICSFEKKGDKRDWSGFVYDEKDFMIELYIGWEGTHWRVQNNLEKWLEYTYGGDWNIPIPNLTVSKPLGG
jgi:hypothetical protein